MTFQKGHTPWNKGLKGLLLNTGRTHFKKNHTPSHKGRIKYNFKCLNCKDVKRSFVPNRKYCSWNCYEEVRLKSIEKRKKEKIIAKIYLEKRNKVLKNCIICDNKFKVPKYNERFTCCSKECRLERCRRRMIGNQINLGRKQSEEAKERRKGLLKGEKHPNWLGGKSFEPYDKTFNEEFRNLIRKRDNYICMVCGKEQEELKRKLDIHHINYDKLLSIPENCISLCNSCHPKTNRNRTHWIKFFQSLLTERYNYKYFESKEIILEVNRYGKFA